MQRKENESFEADKARRAVANTATKNINAKTKGGNVGNRAELRQHQRAEGKGKIKGTYGQSLMAKFATMRATATRFATHAAHLRHMAERKARRAANDSAGMLAA
jgi:hypothetical protein